MGTIHDRKNAFDEGIAVELPRSSLGHILSEYTRVTTEGGRLSDVLSGYIDPPAEALPAHLTPQAKITQQLRFIFIGLKHWQGLGDYGLNVERLVELPRKNPYVLFLHGTTWDTKHWPAANSSGVRTSNR